MILGSHVDQHDPIGEAKARGAQAVQIMLGNPQSFRDVSVAHSGGAEVLRQEAVDAGVDIYVHSHYVINIASTNNRVRIPSRKLLQRIVDGAAEIGAKGVVVHGGHVAADDEVETGFDNWRKCVDGLDLAVPVLIENTAGGKFAMARGLERLGGLWEAIKAADGFENVGFCLDTCHAFAGGEELPGLADRIRAITGRIDLVHANDSQGEFNSGVDRHANLGQGLIPPAELAALIRDAAAPVVLETPGGPEEHLADLAWLRERL
ncbi:MAG TPA: deoxyribonuclease IV [Actinomycetales bacterium]|nr:deoxyribonuclease IV [Actinomycetales bacterium]